jgi:hypothetical protein
MITILLVILFGFLSIAGLIAFGWRKLQREWNNMTCIYTGENNGPCKKAVSCKTLQEIYTSFLERRNEFWHGLGQFTIIIVIITLLVVLLIMEKIPSESAIPLIAGLGSFSIGKGVSSIKNNTYMPENQPPKPTENKNEEK